ncbi:hypothetical protein ACH4Q7_22335 [Streptomyces roseolus]|uniref:hypothetical protein n=1 Tax=Streptomyces roseolus TaxID=67358 RepID=UPI003787C769
MDQHVRVEVIRTPVIPHGGRAYLDGDVTGDGLVTLWVLQSLVTEQEAADLAEELTGLTRRKLLDLLA